MKKILIGIMIFGWVEILTITMCVNTLLHIDYYSVAFLFLPFPVLILGILTVRLNPLARRLNIILSPLIVFTYASGIMMIIESILKIFDSHVSITQWHFGAVFIIALIVHIIFFTRPEVKAEFKT